METSLSCRARLSLFFQYKYLRILIKVVLATERRGRRGSWTEGTEEVSPDFIIKEFIHSFMPCEHSQGLVLFIIVCIILRIFPEIL